VNLSVVKKVILLPYLEKMPGAPHYVVGLLNEGGICFPVIDLALYLKLPSEEKYTLDTPVLICHINSLQIGLIIKKVIGLSTLSETKIKLPENKNQPLFVSVNLNNETSDLMAYLIDVRQIISSHEEYVTS
jgi:purine-binding chemotaxis protein CheW